MTANIEKWVKAHPVAALLIVALVFTWVGWVPQALYSHGLFPFDSPVFYVLGGTGPLLAVFVILRILHGQWEFGLPFAPYLRWREGAIWYAVALLLYPSLWLIVLALRGNPALVLTELGGPVAGLSTFLISLIAAVPEEVAWRGFVLPRLQTRYNALISSVILWAFAAVWHLPLLLTKGSVMASYAKIPYFLELLALTILYTWIFNSTRGSLLYVTLFHAASNSFGPYLGLTQTAVFGFATVILIAVFGYAHLARNGEHRVKQALQPAVPAG